MMNIVLTGSVAYDYLMTFPGRFRDHILPDRLDSLSLSFLVDSMVRQRGGIAANIAYTLALLSERPRVMATVGEDFQEYREWLESNGVDTSAIRQLEGIFTASFFVNTDQVNAQIATFYSGAMSRAAELSFAELNPPPDLAMISANDPKAMINYVEECRRLEVAYMYDPGQQVVRLDGDQLRAGLRGATAIFVNDYEFGLIEEKTGLKLEELLAYARFVVITRGDRGADLYTRDEEVRVPAVPERQLADPTGVGDAFRGGFLKGYAHSLDLTRCTQMGVLAATYCIENRGTQGHRFSLQEFVTRFRRHFNDEGELDRLL